MVVGEIENHKKESVQCWHLEERERERVVVEAEPDNGKNGVFIPEHRERE